MSLKMAANASVQNAKIDLLIIQYCIYFLSRSEVSLFKLNCEITIILFWNFLSFETHSLMLNTRFEHHRRLVTPNCVGNSAWIEV